MRTLLGFFAAAAVTALSGCGSHGGGSNPPSNPALSNITGTVFASNTFFSGTVTAYSFQNGVKGSTLATSTIGTANPVGQYSLRTPTGVPLLLEVTDACYPDTASWRVGTALTTITVCPINDNLHAVVVPISGLNTVSITPFTSAAAGLATYLYQHGHSINAAISDANTRISNLVGVNVLSTTPIAPDAEISPAPPYQYGLLLGGMASWIYNRVVTNYSDFGTNDFTTVHLAALIENDLARDGQLNGWGRDSMGSDLALSIGNTPLNTLVYRHQFAAYGVTRLRAQIRVDRLMDTPLFLPFFGAYNDKIDPIYTTEIPLALDESGPVIHDFAPTTGYTGGGDITGVVVVDDIVGIPVGSSWGTKLFVDGSYYYTFGPEGIVHWFVNTTIFPNGPHTITMQSTNFLGTTNSLSVTYNFQN